MDTTPLNFNHILNRTEKENQVKDILRHFEVKKEDLLFKRGIYIYGDPGSGKTTFVTNI
jgi:predicted ATPase